MLWRLGAQQTGGLSGCSHEAGALLAWRGSKEDWGIRNQKQPRWGQWSHTTRSTSLHLQNRTPLESHVTTITFLLCHHVSSVFHKHSHVSGLWPGAKNSKTILTGLTFCWWEALSHRQEWSGGCCMSTWPNLEEPGSHCTVRWT